MSDSPAPTETAVQNATINGLAQYVKDFSFENPNAPQSLQPQEIAPAINIQVNVNAKQVDGNDFEVQLKLEGTAKIAELTLFAFDLTYSGLFRLMNIPQEHHHPAVMIECPRLLFPFARQIIAQAVRDGGFPPLYIDPIDFQGLYNQEILANQGKDAGQAPGATPLH